MKLAHEYVAAYMPEQGHGERTMMFREDAERAVADALADAQRYRELLQAALRAHRQPQGRELLSLTPARYGESE